MADGAGAARPEKDKGGAAENRTTITIVYNGGRYSLQVNSKQALQAVLQHALQLVGSPGGPVLFNAGGQELDLNRSVEDHGITEGTQIALRPRVASGG